MKNSKKVAIGLGISSLVLAIVTIFMGFAAGIKYDAEGGQSIKLFDYIFKAGDFKSLPDGAKLHNAGLIVGFVLLIIAIVALIVVGVLNATKKSNKKVNMIVSIVAIVCLVVASILVFLTKTFFLKIEYEGVKPFEEIKDYIKLGVGAILAGVFGLLSAATATAGLVIYAREAK